MPLFVTHPPVRGRPDPLLPADAGRTQSAGHPHGRCPLPRHGLLAPHGPGTLPVSKPSAKITAPAAAGARHAGLELATAATWAAIWDGTRPGWTPYGWPVPKLSETSEKLLRTRWQ